jgi:hypothetical protein
MMNPGLPVRANPPPRSDRLVQVNFANRARSILAARRPGRSISAKFVSGGDSCWSRTDSGGSGIGTDPLASSNSCSCATGSS